MKFQLSSLFCLFLFLTANASTDMSSNTNTEDTKVENLYLLGKVWGFLKYHHPKVTEGKYDWDAELFKMLPFVEEENFKNALYKHIKTLDNTSDFAQMNAEDVEVKHEPNTSWIKDVDFLGAEISTLLLSVEKAERKEQQHYVEPNKDKSYQPKFINEKPYKNMKVSDEKYRLLCLFRFWNMVEYFSPHRHLTDTNWDDVLKEFIPKYRNIETTSDYQLTTLELIAKLQDSHSYMSGNSSKKDVFFGEKIVPIKIKFIEGKPIVERVIKTPDNKLTIKKGDEIIAINGILADEIIKEKAKYMPASNLSYQYQKLSKILLRTNENKVELTLSNAQGEYTEKVYTHLLKDIWLIAKAKPAHQEIGANIGYINPRELEKEDIKDVMKAFEDKAGIVFDLRCYPKFTVHEFGKYFMPKRTVFAEYVKFDPKQPGQFNVANMQKIGEENADYYKGKIAILIDESSISRSEFTAMGIRVAPNAIVVGSTTAGADGESSSLILPGNLTARFTSNGVYNTDGSETQRVGIIPDVEVRPTIKGFRAGRDEVLEAAVQQISQ